MRVGECVYRGVDECVGGDRRAYAVRRAGWLRRWDFTTPSHGVSRANRRAHELSLSRRVAGSEGSGAGGMLRRRYWEEAEVIDDRGSRPV